MVAVAVAAFVVTWLLGLWLVSRAARRAGGVGDFAISRLPGREDNAHVPRSGGALMAMGCLAAACAAALLQVTNTFFDAGFFAKVLLTVAPMVLVGLAQDRGWRRAARLRWVGGFASAVLGIWLLDLTVPRLGLGSTVDAWWASAPSFGLAVAALALMGTPRAFRVIDGYNGLAGFVALGICVALAHVALQVGDRQLASVAASMAGATAGFLVWNSPRGAVLAGHAGGYLWGALIAVVGLLLVVRHVQVSPFFPLLLLMYPAWETVFSSYRSLMRDEAPGVEDAVHFHHLVYRRVVRGVFHDKASRRLLMRKNRTSPYLWGFFLLTVAPAVLFWNKTGLLMAFCAVFVLGYATLYVVIIRFKVPRWLRRG